MPPPGCTRAAHGAHLMPPCACHAAQVQCTLGVGLHQGQQEVDGVRCGQRHLRELASAFTTMHAAPRRCPLLPRSHSHALCAPTPQADHPDLKPNIHPVTMALYKAGKLTDNCGHGTHVAGARGANRSSRALAVAHHTAMLRPRTLPVQAPLARRGSMGTGSLAWPPTCRSWLARHLTTTAKVPRRTSSRASSTARE